MSEPNGQHSQDTKEAYVPDIYPKSLDYAFLLSFNENIFSMTEKYQNSQDQNENVMNESTKPN